MTTNYEIVTKRAKCKRCGSNHCAWQKSARSGKWYLTEVFFRNGEAMTDSHDFHSTYCASNESHMNHDTVQGGIMAAEQAQEVARDEAARARQDERLEQETEQLRIYMLMTKPERDHFRAVLLKKLEALKTQDPTMDYFTEQMKWRAEVNAAQAELEMFEQWEDELADA